MLFRRSEVVVAAYNAPSTSAAAGSRSASASNTTLNVVSKGHLQGTRCCFALASTLLYACCNYGVIIPPYGVLEEY